MAPRTERLLFEVNQLHPSKSAVFRAMGIPREQDVGDEIEHLYQSAFERYQDLISPRGIYTEIDEDNFVSVYAADGMNAEDTPLGRAYPGAKRLALYAFTLGGEISDQVSRLLGRADYPLGYVLNTIASESADNASGVAESLFNQRVSSDLGLKKRIKTLLYSPGYCGWHITAQRKLFDYLNPEQIGITLNPSCLMNPIKSVTGVLVACDPAIHRSGPQFEFCSECRTRTCMNRMK